MPQFGFGPPPIPPGLPPIQLTPEEVTTGAGKAVEKGIERIFRITGPAGFIFENLMIPGRLGGGEEAAIRRAQEALARERERRRQILAPPQMPMDMADP